MSGSINDLRNTELSPSMENFSPDHMWAFFKLAREYIVALTHKIHNLTTPLRKLHKDSTELYSNQETCPWFRGFLSKLNWLETKESKFC